MHHNNSNNKADNASRDVGGGEEDLKASQAPECILHNAFALLHAASVVTEVQVVSLKSIAVSVCVFALQQLR